MIGLLTANRILFAYNTYKKLSHKRVNDYFFISESCDKYDYQDLGDHAEYCRNVKHKLSMSITYHTLKELVDDTLYKELNITIILQITMIMICITFIGIFYNKFKSSINKELPVYNIKKQIKCD